MILVDTSIWVNHLRKSDRRLEKILIDGEVCCHFFVIGELACGNLKNRSRILSLLQDLPASPIIDQSEFLFFIKKHRLNGIGVGFVDVHLLASAMLSNTLLWTSDKRLREAALMLEVAYR